VYGEHDPFQAVTRAAEDRLVGPGVADAKGGIAVMLTALEAFERSECAGDLGWEVVLNPDEEIGSPGSAPFLAEAAKRNDLGLLFEPARPDGSLVDRRRGTGVFVIVARGKAAHSGRDFEEGRSALLAAADLALKLDGLNRVLPGVTVNVGVFESGGAANVVPDLAVLRVNVRTTETADQEHAANAMYLELANVRSRRPGVSFEISGGFTSPPKVPDDRTLALMDVIREVGAEQHLPIAFGPSGGASDGNRLAAAGLPNVDTLGVRGGSIHSPSEYMVISSLAERARLTAGVMMKIARGDGSAGHFGR
jgi:glutamate carboxypeptidase